MFIISICIIQSLWEREITTFWESFSLCNNNACWLSSIYIVPPYFLLTHIFSFVVFLHMSLCIWIYFEIFLKFFPFSQQTIIMYIVGVKRKTKKKKNEIASYDFISKIVLSMISKMCFDVRMLSRFATFRCFDLSIKMVSFGLMIMRLHVWWDSLLVFLFRYFNVFQDIYLDLIEYIYHDTHHFLMSHSA